MSSSITTTARRAGFAARIGRRLLFPLSLAMAALIAFMVLGPNSAAPSEAQRLAVMAPAGAGDGTFAAPDAASATEREIATRYETVRRFPDTTEAYVLLGNAYLQNVREKGDPSDYGRAAAAFNEALRREPDNVDALIGQGSLALARHDFDLALELGTKAVALSPASARAHGVVVDAQTELGRYDEALASTQRMVDLRPDLASLSRVSYQRELHGDVDGAIEAMTRAFEASVGAPVENREYLRVLIGDLHLLKGDVVTARRIYQAALDASPDFVWAVAAMGRADVADGELEAAVANLQTAVDMLPLPEFLVALGEAQAAAGRDRDARSTNELVRAVQALFAANGVNGDLELALFEASHGDAAAAVELARDAYESQPNVKAADALAWALHRAGRSAEAAPYAVEALRLDSPYGHFQFHAGMISFALGDAAAARDHLERALESGSLSPLDRAEARRALTAGP